MGDDILEDYVLGADTAHVTVEWSGPSGRRLVTGGVYEWADPIRDHDKLQARGTRSRPLRSAPSLTCCRSAETARHYR